MENLSDLATSAPIGKGLAKMAAGAINLDKLYTKYVIDAQSNGETPMTKEEFAKTVNI